MPNQAKMTSFPPGCSDVTPAPLSFYSLLQEAAEPGVHHISYTRLHVLDLRLSDPEWLDPNVTEIPKWALTDLRG